MHPRKGVLRVPGHTTSKEKRTEFSQDVLWHARRGSSGVARVKRYLSRAFLHP